MEELTREEVAIEKLELIQKMFNIETMAYLKDSSHKTPTLGIWFNGEIAEIPIDYPIFNNNISDFLDTIIDSLYDYTKGV